MSLLLPLGMALGTAAPLNFVIDAQNDALAWRWRARSTTPIAKLMVFFAQRVGDPHDICAVISADNNGVPTIDTGPTPDMIADIGGGTPTLVTVGAGDITNNAAHTFTFTNPYTPTAGTDYWLCIYGTGAGGTTYDASNRYQITQTYAALSGVLGEIPASSTDGAVATWSYFPSGNITCGAFSVLDGSDNYLPTVCSACPGSATGSVAYQASSNPDEYGNLITVPSETTIDLYGLVYHWALSSASTSDHDLFAYRDPLGTPALLETMSVDVSAYLPINTAHRQARRWGSGPYSLTAGQVAGVAVRATSTGTLTVGQLVCASQAAREAADLFAGVHGMTREGGSGAYTPQTAIIYTVLPYLAHTGTAGGGGTPIAGTPLLRGMVG